MRQIVNSGSRPLALKSGRSTRFSPEDVHGSRSTGPCFAIRAGEWSSRSLYARPSGPEVGEAEGDRIEGTDADRVVVLRARNQQPLPVVEFERLEGAVRRVDEPQVGNSFAGIDRALVDEVESARRGREHLAGPGVDGYAKAPNFGEHKIWGLTSWNGVFSRSGPVMAGSPLPAVKARCIRRLRQVTRRAGAQRRSREAA